MNSNPELLILDQLEFCFENSSCFNSILEYSEHKQLSTRAICLQFLQTKTQQQSFQFLMKINTRRFRGLFEFLCEWFVDSYSNYYACCENETLLAFYRIKYNMLYPTMTGDKTVLAPQILDRSWAKEYLKRTNMEYILD